MAVIEPAQALVVQRPSLLDIIDRASKEKVDVTTLKELWAMNLDWEANEARKAFVVAMNNFKAAPPTITKNKHVQFGQTEYKHATLDHVCDAVIGTLSKHGISHRWKIEQADAWIKVTCVLTHEQGHSEETTLLGAADNTGSKNSIQAIGSTVTYLQRYTLLAACGLAAANTDTDGKGEPAMDNLQERVEWIGNAKDLDELKKLFTVAYEEAKQAKDKNAMRDLIAAKDRRKKEIQ